MKRFNKQILKAINRGILLALDDFEDIEDNSSISSDVINTEDVIKQKVDLMNEVVDLGLPSGTLWCKYNLDVNPNLLSKAEDWYGGWYAWGELKPNKPKGYAWETYKFGNYNKLTKYCNNPNYGLNGFTDNLTNLLPEDDAAYLNKKLYNYKFHIPTKEQFEELLKYTTNYWVNNYDPDKTIHNSEDDGGIKDLNGRVFVGKNENLLFIPAAGGRLTSRFYEVSLICNLWSLSLDLVSPYYACYWYFNSANSINIHHRTRCAGCNIRPVVNL